MTAQRISNMNPARTPLDGQELFETVQNGRTLKVSLENIRVFTGGGKSAYDVAVDRGFSGTVDDWLLTLRGPKGPKGDTGDTGAQGPKGDDGLSAFEIAQAEGFTGTRQEWLESLIDGEISAGLDGKSAYQIAVDDGFTGTETEWLEWLKGADGDQGPTGPAGPKGDPGDAGPTGPMGPEGKSAYQVAVENGFGGTEAEWLASLEGGGSGDGTAGADGASAYELAVEDGFAGSLTEWLASLEGPEGPAGPAGADGNDGLQGPQGVKGDDGRSAYQVAVDDGFVGSETEWLASLKGQDGADGTGGSGGGSAALTVDVNGFTANDFTLPEGVTVEKEYSDSSLVIHHNQGKLPTGWFMLNLESTPFNAVYPTSTRNLQVIDENTVIVTNVASFEVFKISLHF